MRPLGLHVQRQWKDSFSACFHAPVLQGPQQWFIPAVWALGNRDSEGSILLLEAVPTAYRKFYNIIIFFKGK